MLLLIFLLDGEKYLPGFERRSVVGAKIDVLGFFRF